MPKIIGNNAELYLGDWRDILPSISDKNKLNNNLLPDVIVTDPPYGLRYKSGPNSKNSISSTGKRFQRTIIGDNTDFDPTPFLEFSDVIFTGASHFYSRLPPGGSLHSWDKRGDYKSLDQSDCDIIWRKIPSPSRTFHCVWRGICRHTENKSKILHPTQKPIALMEWLIGMTEGVVCDPFMGSGTTGVACMNLGRKFVGIEIFEEYFDIACERISNAHQQKRIFYEPAP